MEIKYNIAHLLLDAKVVTFNFNQPYQFTSGIVSPVYSDNRLIISFPDKRKQVIDGFLQMISAHHIQFDVIAGIATAGIPHAAWLADRLDKPLIYVRGASKEYGKKNQIEGSFSSGQTALLIEDHISTGGSVLNAADCLLAVGIKANHCLAISTYQFNGVAEKFAEKQIECMTLTDFNTLLEVAEEEGYINHDQKQAALLWRQDPVHWGVSLQEG